MSRMIAKGSGWTVFVMSMGMLALACGSNNDNAPHTGKHDIWFMGAVIDGASGKPLTDYNISLVWGTNTAKGKVDANSGRYTVGPLPAWNDYGVIISADGYRAFSSYNPALSPPAPANNSLAADVYTADTSQTFNFDASLFPSTLTPPDISILVLETGNSDPKAAAGKIRLQPTTQPPLQSAQTEIQGQVWANDADLYAGALSADFTGGVFKAPAAMLTYGVTYAVTVYDVDGYQASTPATVQAGVNTGMTISVAPQTVAPLVLIANTASSCRPPVNLTDAMAAVITLTFNQPVEDGTTTPGGGAEQLDNGLSISVTTTSFPAMTTLNTRLSSTVQEDAVTLTFADNVATIAWNPNMGLASKGTGESIRTVTYSPGSLGSTYVQVPKHTETRVSLATLLGSTVTFNGISCTAP